MQFSLITFSLVILLSACVSAPPMPPRIERLPEGAAGPIVPAVARPLSLTQVADMARGGTPANVIIQSLRDSRATYAIGSAEASELSRQGVPYEAIEYLRWGERRGFKTELMEASPGDVAGIKSATIKFEGDYAFGWLRTETGVHRLVRKSPFDSGNRRHTSFSSVFVSPEVDDDVDIEINPADLRTDVYRASGAGGQHVNRTESAVRITHIPTNIVVQCQSDRSQHKNRSSAMKQLKSKLYELEMMNRMVTQQALEATKSDVGWGSQIRSYVLDQSRIKDLRTNVETSNPQPVLDGDLDMFIEASLKSGL